MTSIRKILVRAPNWIGDGVMTTPMLSALRLFFKEAEIVLLAKPPMAALFVTNDSGPYTSHLLLVSPKWPSLDHQAGDNLLKRKG